MDMGSAGIDGNHLDFGLVWFGLIGREVRLLGVFLVRICYRYPFLLKSIAFYLLINSCRAARVTISGTKYSAAKIHTDAHLDPRTGHVCARPVSPHPQDKHNPYPRSAAETIGDGNPPILIQNLEHSMV